MESAQFARKSSRITTTLCQITNGVREWEEHGETTIQTIFKRRIGGAMEKRDQQGWGE
jgi:hypothetical protein